MTAREMHAGDLLNLDMLKQVIEVPFEGFLWGQSRGMMTPFVCEKVFGDGLHLLTITTLNQRPNYYVVRTHSGWEYSQSQIDHVEEVVEHVDKICWAIEDECGRKRWNEDDRGDGRDRFGRYTGRPDPWPAIDADDGCSWGNIRWPWLMDAIGYSAMIERLTTGSQT